MNLSPSPQDNIDLVTPLVMRGSLAFTKICHKKRQICLSPFLWSKLPANRWTAPSLNSFNNLIRPMDIHGLVKNNCNYYDLCRE